MSNLQSGKLCQTMLTRLFKINPNEIDTQLIFEAADILKKGGLLAFPTETVYGLGANALDEKASKKIYAAKGRPSDNPLIAHISNMEMLEMVTKGDLSLAEILAKEFWPGPLTMILNKSEIVPYGTTGGLDTVAVRMPDRKVAKLIIENAGIPIAAPSANISGRPSATCVEHVIEDFDGRIDGIVDDGPARIGLESTIIDLTSDTPVLLRRGFIRAFEIEKVLGTPIEDTFGSKEPDKPKAPGMKYRHYAPKSTLYIVRNENKIKELVNSEQGKTIGVICCEENKGKYEKCNIYPIGKKSKGAEIAKNLFAALRRLDDDNIQVAFCEDFSNIDHGEAIMERLYRASGGKIIL